MIKKNYLLKPLFHVFLSAFFNIIMAILFLFLFLENYFCSICYSFEHFIDLFGAQCPRDAIQRLLNNSLKVADIYRHKRSVDC